MELLNVYKSILRFSGLEADADGFVSTVLGDKREPALINGMRLVLPTDNHLRNNDGQKVIFHPLSENILRGESEVISKLTEVINIRLNFTFGIIAQSLLNLVDSPELHKRLNSSQLSLLIAIKEVDNTTLTNFINVMLAGIKSQPSKVFTNIYLNRGGSLGERRYSRVAVVSFPMWKELQENADTLFGVKIRVKDRDTFKQLFKFVFQSLVNGNEYSRGSDSNTAPYLDVLMRSAMGIAACLNDLLVNYKEFIEDADKLMFDGDWAEAFDRLDDLVPEIRRIPVQAGNEGRHKVGEVVSGKPAQAVVKPELPSQAAWTPQPPTPPQQPPAPPAPVKTSGGLDFNSVMAANPAMMGVPNQMPGQMPYMPQQPNVPRWAMPQQGYPQQMPPGYPQQMQQMPPGYPQQGYPQQMPPGYPQQMQQMPMQQMSPGYPQQMPPGYPQQMPPGYPQQMQQMPPGYPQQMPVPQMPVQSYVRPF